jgi:hypothetical protein
VIDGYTIIYLKILWIICIYVWLKRSGRNPLCMNFDYGCLHNISVVTTVNFICVGPRRNQEKNTAKMTRSFHFTFRYMDDVLSLNNSKFVIPPLPGGGGCILLYLCPSFRPSVRPSVCLSFRPSKIFFVAFFSATMNGRNLIFGHKLHIGMPYCG